MEQVSQIVSVSLEEELKKHPELKVSDIESLREWNRNKAHLPKISDNSLALFLHSNYYHMESTKINIENYYTFRAQAPEFFSNRDPLTSKDLRRIFNVISIISLKQFTKDDNLVLYVRLIDTDPSKFVFHEYVKLIYAVSDLAIYHKGTVNKYILIIDFYNVSVRHANCFNPSSLKKYLNNVRNGLQVKIDEIHFVNVNHGMEAIVNIVKPLLSKHKCLDVYHIHTSTDTLEKFVPIEALPNEAGGKAGPIMDLNEAQIKELEEYRNWFVEEELRSRVDETKRPRVIQNGKDLFVPEQKA